VSIRPNLETKREIIKDAVSLMHIFGYARPYTGPGREFLRGGKTEIIAGSSSPQRRCGRGHVRRL
jgi:hypothetical protein